MKQKKKKNRRFFVHRGEFNQELGEPQVFVIETSSKGLVIGSCRIRMGDIRRVENYKLNTKDNYYLDYSAEALAPAVLAPVYGQKLKRKEYCDLANNLNELKILLKDADTVFRNCKNPPIGDYECYILSHKLITGVYKKEERDLPISNHSWQLRQADDTIDLVLKILRSAVRLQPVFEHAAGSEDAVKFYTELLNTLRYLKIPKKNDPDKYTSVSGNYIRKIDEITKSFIWTNFEGDIVYMGESVEGEKKAQSLIRQLEDWSEKLNRTAMIIRAELFNEKTLNLLRELSIDSMREIKKRKGIEYDVKRHPSPKRFHEVLTRKGIDRRIKIKKKYKKSLIELEDTCPKFVVI